LRAESLDLVAEFAKAAHDIELCAPRERFLLRGSLECVLRMRSGWVSAITRSVLQQVFPPRVLIIFATFGVIFVALVLQVFSLSPLVRRFGLEGDDAEVREERLLRVAMADAALDVLRRIARDEEIAGNMIAAIRHEYEARWRAAERTHLPQQGIGTNAATYRSLRRRRQNAERNKLLQFAKKGKVWWRCHAPRATTAGSARPVADV
jgi:hypothetical protein